MHNGLSIYRTKYSSLLQDHASCLTMPILHTISGVGNYFGAGCTLRRPRLTEGRIF